MDPFWKFFRLKLKIDPCFVQLSRRNRETTYVIYICISNLHQFDWYLHIFCGTFLVARRSLKRYSSYLICSVRFLPLFHNFFVVGNSVALKYNVENVCWMLLFCTFTHFTRVFIVMWFSLCVGLLTFVFVLIKWLFHPYVNVNMSEVGAKNNNLWKLEYVTSLKCWF